MSIPTTTLREPRRNEWLAVKSVCETVGVRPSLSRPRYWIGKLLGEMAAASRVTGMPLATYSLMPSWVPNGSS